MSVLIFDKPHCLHENAIVANRNINDSLFVTLSLPQTLKFFKGDFLMRYGKLALASTVLFALGILSTSAQSQSMAWNGPSSGDTATMFITFPGFVADHLDSITGPGYAHNHSNLAALFTIDLLIDGSYQTVDSYFLPDGNNHPLSERGPIAFTSGLITGIQLTDMPRVGSGYHGFSFGIGNDTVFNFSAQATPEPGSFALLSVLAVTGVGFFMKRRRHSL